MKIKRKYFEGGRYVTVRSVKLSPHDTIKHQKFTGGVPMAEMDDGTKIRLTKNQMKLANLVIKESYLGILPYYHYVEENTGEKIKVSKIITNKLLDMKIFKKMFVEAGGKEVEIIVVND